MTRKKRIVPHAQSGPNHSTKAMSFFVASGSVALVRHGFGLFCAEDS